MQENINVTNKDVSSKNAKKQALSYLTELQKGHLTNIDNMKLIKQINSCFNDNPYPKYPSAAAKQKQKLNKSFENILAANKHSMKINTEASKVSKKNMSSSPKRNSSSGKKSGISKSGGTTKRKYLDQNKPSNPPNKALYNMRDLNFFIKTIEKDLTDKYSKPNSKDFNSMPTTPTSILKKVED